MPLAFPAAVASFVISRNELPFMLAPPSPAVTVVVYVVGAPVLSAARWKPSLKTEVMTADVDVLKKETPRMHPITNIRDVPRSVRAFNARIRLNTNAAMDDFGFMLAKPPIQG